MGEFVTETEISKGFIFLDTLGVCNSFFFFKPLSLESRSGERSILIKIGAGELFQCLCWIMLQNKEI